MWETRTGLEDYHLLHCSSQENDASSDVLIDSNFCDRQILWTFPLSCIGHFPLCLSGFAHQPWHCQDCALYSGVPCLCSLLIQILRGVPEGPTFKSCAWFTIFVYTLLLLDEYKYIYTIQSSYYVICCWFFCVLFYVGSVVHIFFTPLMQNKCCFNRCKPLKISATPD